MPSNPFALRVLKREPRLGWDIRSWFNKFTMSGEGTKLLILRLSKGSPS